MARSFGRVFASIWNDDDFRALSVNARMMYVFLISQPDLDHAGVIPLRTRRWSRSLAVPVAEVEKVLGELDDARFAVIDWDTEELLVRSLIRRDEIWRQPNVFKSAAASAAAAGSAGIKAALLDEMRRLDLSAASREIQRTRDELITLLEPFGNPSPTPPGAASGPPVETPAAGPVDSEPDMKAETRNGAGRKGSGRVSEPLAKGTGEVTGKGIGDGYGPVPLEALPLSLSPQPSPSPRATPRDPVPPRPLFPAAVPDLKAEGEDRNPAETPQPDYEPFIAEVRVLRPDWSTRSIRRALREPSVTERPWPLACEAMRILAADPATQHPGRLEHDGPWWDEAARRTRAAGRPAPRTHRFDPDPETRSCRICKSPQVDVAHTREKTA